MSWLRDLFQREKRPAYDAEKLQPAVRRSFCNQEMSFGFIEKETGKFREYSGGSTEGELEEFCRQYGIRPEDLKTIY